MSGVTQCVWCGLSPDLDCPAPPLGVTHTLSIRGRGVIRVSLLLPQEPFNVVNAELEGSITDAQLTLVFRPLSFSRAVMIMGVPSECTCWYFKLFYRIVSMSSRPKVKDAQSERFGLAGKKREVRPR